MFSVNYFKGVYITSFIKNSKYVIYIFSSLTLYIFAAQIYDLFEEMILLPQLQHIKLEKPLKPRPDSNIYDLPVYDKWWLIKPKPEEDEEV